MAYMTVIRMYHMRFCDRVMAPFKFNNGPVIRHAYSVTDTGRRWMRHYELVKEKYGS